MSPPSVLRRASDSSVRTSGRRPTVVLSRRRMRDAGRRENARPLRWLRARCGRRGKSNTSGRNLRSAGERVRPHSCIEPANVKVIPRASRSFLAAGSIVVISACATFSAQPNISANQIAAIRADSAAFAAIASQFVRRKTDTTRFTEVRVNPDPDARTPSFQSVAGGSTGAGVDPPILTSDSTTIRLITENRKRVLAAFKIPEGQPTRYPRCGGSLAPPPPPAPPGDPPRPGFFELRSGCPTSGTTYVTVSRPIPGEPEGLKKADRDKTPLTGEIWTVNVGSRYAGPEGQSWFLNANLLTRDAPNGPLRVARTILLAWEE